MISQNTKSYVGASILTFGLSLTSLAFSTSAAAGTKLSEPALFARCYAQVTGKPVPLNHFLAKSVREGRATALDACFTVLDKAKLTSSGQVSVPADGEAVSVLNQFYNYHRTLFPVNSQEQLPHYSVEYSLGTSDLYDMTEGALAMTKVMFGTHKYSDLLTTLGGVRAIRQEDPYTKAIYGFNVNSPIRRFTGNAGSYDDNRFAFRSFGKDFQGDGSGSDFIQMPMIQMGTLIGVRDATERGMVNSFARSPFDNTRAEQIPGLAANYDVLATYGGGVMGYPSYLMQYLGHQDGIVMDGALKVPRKWAVQSLKTFMCTNMPALRASDVSQYLVPTSTTPFRTQTSCVQCHATQDQMAYTARNHIVAFSDLTNTNVPGGKDTTLVGHFNVAGESVAGWPSEAVPNFSKQKPTGRFYFRSVTGAFYDQPVNDMNGLGAAMTQTDDYYQCAAKHYFEMLTGNSVPLFDRGNPVNSDLLKTLTAEQIADRKYVEGLGDQLKKDQSAINLVKSILSSDYFKSTSFRP